MNFDNELHEQLFAMLIAESNSATYRLKINEHIISEKKK